MSTVNKSADDERRTQKKASARKSRAPRLNRSLHRWGALISALPLLVVILTGILLQLKKDWTWVQPTTMRGARPELTLSWSEILDAASTAEAAGITSWEDVDRLDVRPSKGVVKVRAKNRWEVQVDSSTGAVLQTSYRRSDFIESLHDGSFFGGTVKLWVFLPCAVILFCLWVSGVYLWLLPHMVRRRRKAASSQAT